MITTEQFLGICAPGATTVDNLNEALLNGAPPYLPNEEKGTAVGGARAMVFHLLIELTKIGIIGDEHESAN